MMLTVLSVFGITLGLGQLISTGWGLRGVSLTGAHRLVGYSLGLVLVAAGVFTIMPGRWSVLWWTLPAGPLAVVVLLIGGSFIDPPPPPDRLFAPVHPAHGGCWSVQIPDGDMTIPALLLFPPEERHEAEKRAAVCIIPGAGAHKTFFMGPLVSALLTEGLLVLTLDPPGHGDYRHQPLSYPACLSIAPAAVSFLRQQPGVSQVALIGISMGGALTLKSLAENPAAQIDALVVLETPVRLRYTRWIFYQEVWHTLCGSPVLALLRTMTARQFWQTWRSGGWFSRHSVDELTALYNPLVSIRRLNTMPILLGYSRRDSVAPVEMGRALQQAAPQADLIETKKASHVMLTLLPEVNRQIAYWLHQKLKV
jgi:pimeloyl-ACP methyl ester carboxylesterase